jgi:hypothetical protein
MSAVLALRAQVAEQRCYATDFSAGRNNINGLPLDMLVKIMTLMDVPATALLAQVQRAQRRGARACLTGVSVPVQVCSQWHRASRDSSLWRHFCTTQWSSLINWSVDEVCPQAASSRQPPHLIPHVPHIRSPKISWKSTGGVACTARSWSSKSARRL